MMISQIILFFALLIIFFIECQSIIDDADNNTENDDIDIAKAPFALSLRLNDTHICGAAIISTFWAITAAHCVLMNNVSIENFSVRSGSTYRTSGGSIHNLTEMIIHEKYNDTILDYDVAVFKVNPPFNFDSKTKSIALPRNSMEYNWATAVGWGAFSIYNESILSDDLKSVKLPLIEKQKCIEDYEGFVTVTPRQLCYGYQQGGTDTCKGDSGGPLFNSDYILIGITSWGYQCGEKYSPGVYTNVEMMSEWINEHAHI